MRATSAADLRPVEVFRIPGSDAEAVIERAPDGRLLRFQAGGREYARETDGEIVLGDGLARVREASLPSGQLRHVQACGERWVEEYLWDEQFRPTSVDGVRIERDAIGRVTACLSSMAEWRYGYAGGDLAVVSGPFGSRHITRGSDGRPIRVRGSGETREIRYDSEGVRCDAGTLPDGYYRDPMGRLWTITDAQGRVSTTFLWNGLSCFGRIDGPPGDPLAAVFSLDPTSTPVRVITRDSLHRIPRDAFGEGLLGRSGVPGLYGSASFQGQFYFLSRSLDPITGAFTSPDPLSGAEHDPRRSGGFRGPLPVDNAAAGSYAVCQNDPIGRSDPLGQFSVPLLLASLTWAWGNNAFSMLVMDATLNFWLSLFNFEGRDDLQARFWHFDGLLASDRVGAWALHRDGFWSKDETGQAWTFQHICYAGQDKFSNLDRVRLFRPDSAFLPTLYGTLLKVQPPDILRSFLLTGSHNTTYGPNPAGRANVLGWARHGGPAEAVIPGSRVPRFPEGGLHFSARDEIHYPADATLIEAEPGVISTGLLKNDLEIVFSGTPSPLVVGDRVFYTNFGGEVAVYTLTAVDSGAARQTLRAEPSYLVNFTPDPVRGIVGEVRAVEAAPLSSEDLNAPLNASGNPVNNRLNLPGAGPQYAIDDPLRLLQGGIEMGAALVRGFETQLALDAPIDSAMSVPPDLGVFVAAADGAIASLSAVTRLNPAGGPSQLDFSPADAPVPSAPALSLAGTVTAGAVAIPVVLTPTADPKVMQADRPLDALGATGTAAAWQQFARGAALGRRSGGPEGAPAITYTPDTSRAGPTSGFVWVEDAGGRISLRAVLSKPYDALLLSAPLLGNASAPYTVERLAYRTGDAEVRLSPVSLSFTQEIRLDTATDLSSFAAFQLFRVEAGRFEDAVDTELLTAAAMAGTSAAVTVAAGSLPDAPFPGQIVALRQAGAVRLAAVRSVRVTFRVERMIRIASSGPIEAVPVARSISRNDGTVINARQIMVHPSIVVNATTTPPTVAPTSRPLYRPGERVTISWTGGNDEYQVIALEGEILVLEPGVGIDLNAGNTGHVVQRGATSDEWPYDAERVDEKTVTLFPTDRFRRLPPSGPGRVEMPQFRAGELVLVDWAGDTPGQRRYRVKSVEGTTLELADDADLPADTPELLVTRLRVGDPVNGTSRSGINGEWVTSGASDAGHVTSNHIRFSVWRPSDFQGGTEIAFTEEGISHAALIDPTTDHEVVIEFTAPHGLTGNADILSLSFADRGFSPLPPGQPDDHSTADFLNSPVLARPGAGRVVILPYAQARTMAGQLHAGTQRIPEEITYEEIDRKQALIDHELTHTRQSIEWGPALFCYFPVWLMELAGDIFSDQNLPAFSAYVQGTIRPDGARRMLKIDGGAVEFSEDDRVEIAQGGSAELYKLGEKDGDSFPIVKVVSEADPFGSISEPVPVHVRRVQGNEIWKWIMDSQRWLTIGGITKVGFGGTWGGFALGLGKLGYFLMRKLFLTDKTYPAMVDDSHQKVTIAGGKISEFTNAKHIRIGQGDQIRLREVRDRTDDSLLLETPIEFTGAVEVSPFSEQNAFSNWDWNSYHPATIPDTDRPSRIQIAPIGTDKLKLRVFDRVIVTDGTTSRTCYVTNVEAEDIVELNRAPFSTTPAPDHVFQVAPSGVESTSPIGNILNPLHANWMRYLIDPWGQIKPEAYRRGLRTDTGWGKFFTGLVYTIRYAFSTESWAMLPFFGYFWWDHVFGGKDSEKSYLSEMEQGASQESGNLYTHLSRMRYSPAAVGDVGQFWHFQHSGSDTTIQMGSLDTPGVHALSVARIVPFVADSGASRDMEPNRGWETPEASQDSAAAACADLLTAKPAASPGALTQTNPRSLSPSELAWVPASRELECAVGNYFAFTAPGKHRVTVANVPSTNDDKTSRGGEAQAAKKHTLGIFETDDPLQTILFDVDVADINVTVSGLSIGNGDTLTLLPMQRAVVTVNGLRDPRYTLMLVRPSNGVHVRTGSDGLELAAQKIATPTGVPEPAAVARVHAFNAALSRFSADSLADFGMHLTAEDVLIPARNFSIRIAERPPVVREVPAEITLDLYDSPPPELHPGEEAFVLVAAPVKGWDVASFEYPLPPPAGTADPVVVIEAVEDLSGFSDSVRAFLGENGRIFRIRLNDAPPPSGNPFLLFPITVGTEFDGTVVTARIPLRA